MIQVKKLSEEWISDKPPQVTFIPTMKRQELARYFSLVDGVIGQVSGLQGSVERQALLCKKPLIHFSEEKYKSKLRIRSFSSSDCD